ncbi:MAG: amidohydrolase family protein [Acidobacteriaceae bacterium]|nr:amidohydrolase family protein [Acidobacteriaceae bacterium]
MAQVFLLRGAKQLLTLRGPSGIRRGAALQDLGIIEDGSVLIRDGTIAAVGSTRRLENLKEAREAIEIPATGNVVMPAFVDPNLHLSLTGSNGSPEHKRKKLGEFYDESLALMRACLQHGTLNAEVKAHGHKGDLHSDISVLRQLSNIGNQPVGMARTWRIGGQRAAGEPFTQEFRQALDTVLTRKLVNSIEFAAHPDQPVNRELLAAAQGRDLNLELEWAGGDAQALAENLDRFRPATVFCPSDLSPEECSVLSGISAAVVFAPGREIVEDRGGDAARRLLEAGAAIAIGSGYHATQSPTFSMQMAVALAVFRSRLTVEAAISAATINAAYAIGCGHLRGSLEYGKRADLLMLNLPDYREIPRRFGVNHVGIAIRDGNLVLNRTRWKIGA